MNVKDTIEVVNTCETIKKALENEYRGCVVDSENECVTIDDVIYYYDLIKHMDEVDLSLYSLTEIKETKGTTVEIPIEIMEGMIEIARGLSSFSQWETDEVTKNKMEATKQYLLQLK